MRALRWPRKRPALSVRERHVEEQAALWIQEPGCDTDDLERRIEQAYRVPLDSRGVDWSAFFMPAPGK